MVETLLIYMYMQYDICHVQNVMQILQPVYNFHAIWSTHFFCNMRGTFLPRGM